jgi:hypothetical protein
MHNFLQRPHQQFILQACAHAYAEVLFVQALKVCARTKDDAMLDNESLPELWAISTLIDFDQQVIGRSGKDAEFQRLQLLCQPITLCCIRRTSVRNRKLVLENHPHRFSRD